MGEFAGCQLNRYIEIPSIVHRRWHASERDFGMCVPATEHVGVRGSRAEIWLAQQ